MTCTLGMINPDCAKICPKHRRCEEDGSKRWLNEPVRVVPPRKRGKVKGYIENMITDINDNRPVVSVQNPLSTAMPGDEAERRSSRAYTFKSPCNEVGICERELQGCIEGQISKSLQGEGAAWKSGKALRHAVASQTGAEKQHSVHPIVPMDGAVPLSPSELQILANLEVTGESKWIAENL